MVLDNLKKSKGDIFFKYRGQFPILIFFLALPFLYYMHDVKVIIKNAFNCLSLFFIILGFLIRFYAIGTTPKGTSGRNRKYQIANSLNSTGIYSIIRHPLYLGNYLIWLAISLFTYNLFFVIIVSFIFWFFYYNIIKTEEIFLEKKFNKEYIDWVNKTPRFFRFNLFQNYKSTNLRFSLKSILRREYSGLLSAVISFVYIDIIRQLFLTNNLEINQVLLIIFIIIVLLSLILKILKTYTRILEEKDRS